MIEVKIKNREGVVVINKIKQQPQEYVPALPNHKQEITLKGRVNHRKAMLKKKYI